MAKYSDEFKLKIVQEYLSGLLGTKLLVKNMVCQVTVQSVIG